VSYMWHTMCEPMICDIAENVSRSYKKSFITSASFAVDSRARVEQRGVSNTFNHSETKNSKPPFAYQTIAALHFLERHQPCGCSTRGFLSLCPFSLQRDASQSTCALQAIPLMHYLHMLAFLSMQSLASRHTDL
jgi:hypothetical protein